MTAKSALISLLVSAAIGAQQVDEVSCANAPVKSDRSLIQFQKAVTAPLHVAENATKDEEESENVGKVAEIFAEVLEQAKKEELQEAESSMLAAKYMTTTMNVAENATKEEEDSVNVAKVAEIFGKVLEQAKKEELQGAEASMLAAKTTTTTTTTTPPESKDTGEPEEKLQSATQHSVEFKSTAPEMGYLSSQSYSDFAIPGSGIVGNVTKEYLVIDLPNKGDGGETVLDKVMMFGFTAGTSGIKSKNQSRIWTMNPSNKKAQLAYVLMMTTIDGEWGAGDWKAHVEFAKPPPDCLKIFPEGGKVAKIDGKLAVVLTCDDEDLCEDGTVIISALQFTPRKGKEKSGRALVIHQDAQAQRAAELSSRALVHKEEWTGTEVDVEFSKNSPDMKNAVSQPYSDFAGPGLVGNVSKSFFEISFVQTEGSQIVYNASADKIQMFGFTSGTSGLQNSNANRIWSGEPSKGTSKLVYGIIMTDVKGPAAWEYNIEFVKPPPQDKFKIFPPDGKVGKANGNLFVAMTCEEPEGEGECHDGKILISGAQFRRMDKKLIKNPEEVKVVATPPPGISS